MNNKKETGFSDLSGYPEDFKTISEYKTEEIQDMERLLDLLWPDASDMKRWKKDILYHYLCAKEQPAHRLSPVDLYNYML